MTAIIWGRLADSEWFGRKRVILIGLLGTAIGALGFGFSQSFATAVFWRCVAGLLNGNIGVMRTMISEIIKEKRYQSRAFLLLPMTFNVGVIIGPLIGAWRDFRPILNLLLSMRDGLENEVCVLINRRWTTRRSCRKLPSLVRTGGTARGAVAA